MTTTDTHCPYCALQCGMRLTEKDGTGVEVLERPAFPVNRGALCGKGSTSAALLSPTARLTAPLVRDRRDLPLREASWDEALDRVAAGLATTAGAHGRDAVGVFGGGGLTNEKAYLLGKFARVVLRTANIDYNGRFCMSAAAAAHRAAFGLDRGLPFPLADISRAGCVILAGANPAETMPPALRYFRELRENGGLLIVVDPRRTRTAELADLHLQPVPGTDLALALGLLHLVVAEGHVDEGFVTERTTGFEQARAAAMAHWPERVERLTGVPVTLMRRTVEMFTGAASGMVLTARGSEQHSKGTDTVGAWINLCLATGNAGRPASGYGCLTGQGNGQGGREHGQKSDQLPGYRSLDDPAARAHVGQVWGIDPADLPGPGRSAYELLDTIGQDGGIRALMLMGSNPVVSAPRAGHVTRRLRQLDFLAVSDLVLSETAALADVVLPAAQWAEETGTTTNLEGRVILRQAAVRPPAQVRTDLRTLRELAARLGRDKGFPDDPQEVFEELRLASAGGPADYAGISYRRIRAEDGVFWPCPEESHPGTPRLFLDRFATPDGRARFAAVSYRPAAEEPDQDYPLYLTTGRVVSQYQSGAQTRRVPDLAAAAPGPFVEIHPFLAQRLGVEEGDPLTVSTRRGRATAPARVTDTIRPDTVFLPFHWGGSGRANSLTNPALDPKSKMPEFKVCAARVERLTEYLRTRGTGRTAGGAAVAVPVVRTGAAARRRIAVVGAGMAGIRFAQQLLAHSPETDVTVYGSEEAPPYNRTLLTGVLAGRFAPEAIALPRDPAPALRTGCPVAGVDVAGRTLRLADGGSAVYDHLVLATGSRPVLPDVSGLRADGGAPRDGVHLLRTLDDCRRLSGRIPLASRAVVIGGGALGVDAAQVLAALGLPTTVVHQAPHLAERHLDDGASASLLRALVSHGVEVLPEARATALLGRAGVTGVALADGRVLEADLVLLACGARPRTELAAAAGIRVASGVMVDDRLATSAPGVSAIGDCAEHRGIVHGLAVPAWEQADVLAARLSGVEPDAVYPGSKAVARLTAGPVQYAAFGEVGAVPGADVVRLVDGTRGTYKKLVLLGDRLVGGILLGDTATAGELTRAFLRDDDLLVLDPLHLLSTEGVAR